MCSCSELGNKETEAEDEVGRSWGGMGTEMAKVIGKSNGITT